MSWVSGCMRAGGTAKLFMMGQRKALCPSCNARKGPSYVPQHMLDGL